MCRFPSLNVFLVIVLLCTKGNALSVSSIISKASQTPKIEKVAIIGSGIAGLSLAHALENSITCAKPVVDEWRKYDDSSNDHNGDGAPVTSLFGVEAHIFDSRQSLNFKAGAGIQLTGGMSALQKINPDLQQATAKASLPLRKIRSRAKPWFDAKNNSKESFSTLLELDIEQEIKNVGGETEEQLIVDGEVMAYTIMRGALQEVLLENLPPNASKRVTYGKTLSAIKSAPKEGIMCEFDDGSEEGPFDLVVGCDGIKSAVKEYVNTGEISNSAEDRSTIYSGIRIQYAVKDGTSKDAIIESSELCQYFGDGAYSLAGSYGAGEKRPNSQGAYLIFKDDDYIGPFKKKNAQLNSSRVKENGDWTQDTASVGSTMLSRIQNTQVPEVQVGPIIEEADRFFELGVYFHNPFSISGWSRQVKGSGGRFAVLSGDAAHAMPPFLGQGSNQAIQDSYTLAAKIFQHNANCMSSNFKDSKKPLKLLLKEYENTRWLPTASITLKAAFLGYLEAGEAGFISKFRDSFFFVAGKIGLARKVFFDSATPKL